MPELRLAFTIVALAAAMVVAATLALRERSAAVLLGLLSFVWLTVDREWEGVVLITVSQTHGLVTSDLVGVAGLIGAAWLWHRARP